MAALERLEDEEREEISEIIAGAVSKHSIYLTKSESTAEVKTSKRSMEIKTKTKKLMETKTKTKAKPSRGLTLESRVCVMGERGAVDLEHTRDQRPDQKGLNVTLWDHKVISKDIFSLALSDPISITVFSCHSATQ